MLICGLENSSRTCSCALSENESILGEVSVELTEHSPVLPGLIDTLLNLAERELEQIDLWAFSIGPGSFTSLRVGLATVKGLAMVSGRPLVSVPTLEAIARDALRTDGLICPLIGARRGEVYYAVYRCCEEGLELVEGPGATHLGVLTERIGGDALFVMSGPGNDELPGSVEGEAIWVHVPHPRASTVCKLGEEKFRRGGGDDLRSLEPLYVKPSYAEEGGRSRIVGMKRDHLDQVMAIETECFPHPWSRRAFLWELDSRIAFPLVSIMNDEVVGYLVVWIVGDEMHLGNIAVGSRYRGRGVGRQLMKWLIEEAARRRIVRVTLEVRTSNESAISLYKRFGFEKVAVREGYYPEGEDALLMALEVQSM
jgi:tRNA threonylcarbamoyladenosine biosynthesis protein TsaB